MKGFTRDELKGQYINCLKIYDNFYSRLVEIAFGKDYFTDAYDAVKALNYYGTFAAIARVKDYEESDFGEVTTDLSSPLEVANSLFYILGEELLFNNKKFLDIFDMYEEYKATDKINNEFIKVIEEI